MIDYRLTPWDARAFGFNTAEITAINIDGNIQNLEKELIEVESKLKEENVKFLYTRIDAQDFTLKKALQDLGYYFAESSLYISKNKIKKFEKEKLPKISYQPYSATDIASIKEISQNSFDYSRFHEDPNIDQSLAYNRYYNWIDDLVAQKANIFVAKVGESIIGFNIQKENEDKSESDLILAGCKRGMEIYVMSLWNEIIEANKDLGVRKIKTVISASNIGVFNVYNHFGFKVDKTLFGFHKWL